MSTLEEAAVAGIGHNSAQDAIATDVLGVAPQRLRSFIERIENLNVEKKALLDDIREVFAEAKGTGFDVKTMRVILKLRALDKDDRDEQEALLDVYKRALGLD